MIIITTQCFAPKIGGIESLMTGMAEAMSHHGEDVTVLADGLNHKDDKEKNYQIIRFSGWKPLRRLRKAKFLKKICEEKDVKAIYADSWKSVEYINEIKTKIIVLAHGTEIPKKNKSLFSFNNRYKKIRIISTYQKVHKIIANSNYTKDLMIASLNVDKKIIKIIHPGIDVYEKFITTKDQIYTQQLLRNKSPIIITLARLEERKGHVFILHAIKELKEEYPNILYLIAGNGPYLSQLKTYINKLDIEMHVKFLDWITEPEKSLLLKNSDIFAMTPVEVGESVEGFGMAYIDAAFHGIPSIGSDSGGISDAILENETGLICKSGDQKNITDNVKLLVKNSVLRKKLGKNGQKLARNKYSWNKKIIEYLETI